MPEVALFYDVAVSRKAIFHSLAEFSQRLSWDPAVSRVYASGGRFHAELSLGFSGVGRWVLEGVPLAEPVSFAERLLVGPRGIEEVKCYWRLEALSQLRTRIHVSCSYRLSPAYRNPLCLGLIDFLLAKMLVWRVKSLGGFLLGRDYSSSEPSVPVMVSLPLVAK